MIDNITIGQYVPGKTWIYKVDPRVKILMVIGLMVLLFLIPNIYIMLGALGLFIVVFLTTRVPFIKMLKGMRPILFLMTFTFVLQTYYNQTGKLLHQFDFTIGVYQIILIVLIVLFYFFTKKYIPLSFTYLLVAVLGCFGVQLLKIDKLNFTTYSYKIYDDGLIKASYMFIRVVLMIGLTSLLTFTTMNTDINNGLESILKPLKIIRVPVSTLSMMMSLTLRFIPTLIDETDKIMKAQSSRGVDFREGSLRQKVNQIVSLLIPMFVISFRRAEELANAMEARGYIVGAKRTKLDKLKLKFLDYFVIFTYLILLAGVIVGRVYL